MRIDYLLLLKSTLLPFYLLHFSLFTLSFELLHFCTKGLFLQKFFTEGNEGFPEDGRRRTEDSGQRSVSWARLSLFRFLQKVTKKTKGGKVCNDKIQYG
jgi:hypothetical protein